MPGWLKALIELFANAFLGFMQEQGRAEVRKEVDDATEITRKEWEQIDRAPADVDASLGRMRAHRGVSSPRRQ
jgi:hypothetical protein